MNIMRKLFFSIICLIVAVLCLSCEAFVKESDEPTLVSLQVFHKPKKWIYADTEFLVLDGLLVIANYSDGNSYIITDYKTTPADGERLNNSNSKNIEYSVVVSYKGKKTDFTIQLKRSVEYSVNYILNGGSKTENGYFPDKYLIPSSTKDLGEPIYRGYEFDGWYTNPEFTGNVVTHLPVKDGYGENISLYAKWGAKKQEYTITYNSTFNSIPETISKYAGEYFSEDELPTLYENGYKFNGWIDKKTGNKVSTKTAVYSDMVLEAVWSKLYTISYIADSSISVPDSITKNDGEYFLENELPTLYKNGYKFNGWIDKKTGNKVSTKTAVYSDMTLEAVWTKLYKISYTTDSSDISVILPKYFYVDKDYCLMENDLKPLPICKANYIFDGWFNDEQKINVGYKVTKDLTLTGKWILYDDGFVLVENGSFKMGESSVTAVNPVHKVSISEFYISPYETTQELYTKIMGINPSYFVKSSNGYEHGKELSEGEIQELRPVEYVTWYDAITFCNKYSEYVGLTPCYSASGETNTNKWIYKNDNYGNKTIDGTISCDFNATGYRLPTEAEWEFAAKGGTETNDYALSGGNNPSEVGWFGNYAPTHQVGKLKPNELGIYDMSGNVSEWCWDWYDDYSSDRTAEPKGAKTGEYRVCRGDSCRLTYYSGSIVNRSSNYPNHKDQYLGFRLVRSTENKIKTCTLTFTTELGTEPKTLILEKGTALSSVDLSSPDIKYKWHRFSGWCIGNEKINAGYVVNDNIVLSASWDDYDDGFIFVEGGTFMMGQSADGDNVEPVHQVTLSDFYVCANSIGGGSTWYSAISDCNELSVREGLIPCYQVNGESDVNKWKWKNKSVVGDITCNFSADGYRLPTEAEWEYVAKGGNKSKGYIYWGTDVPSTGEKINELGIYVRPYTKSEWCWDIYGEYDSYNANNPHGPAPFSVPSARVSRGGSKIVYRGAAFADDYNYYRLVRSVTK